MNKAMLWLCCLLISFPSYLVYSQEQPLRLAVASNFKTTLATLVDDFKRQHTYSITVSSASTGVLYQQIIKGAPFDLFFAADQLRPQQLLEQGIASSSELYAYGRVAFYSAKTDPSYAHQLTTLPSKCRIAIANPAYAPYGIAAKEVIADQQALSHCQQIKGSNIAQAFQFTQLQTVDLGIVAYSHILEQHIPAAQFQLLDERYQVAQAVAVLNRQQQSDAALVFMRYLATPNAQLIISQAGYQGVSQ